MVLQDLLDTWSMWQHALSPPPLKTVMCQSLPLPGLEMEEKDRVDENILAHLHCYLPFVVQGVEERVVEVSAQVKVGLLCQLA